MQLGRIFLIVLCSLWAFTALAQEIRTTQIMPSGMDGTSRFPLSQINDGISSDAPPYNGFQSYSKSGTISFEFDKLYDVQAFRLWNDINVRLEGIQTFDLAFYDANNRLISKLGENETRFEMRADGRKWGYVDVQQFDFPLVKSVARIDLMITSVFDDENSYKPFIEIREVEFVGTATQLNSPPSAIADILTLQLGETKPIDFTANDTDLDQGDRITIVEIGRIPDGIQVIRDRLGNYSVTAGNVPGQYKFQYYIEDKIGEAATGDVTVIVKGPDNRAPVAKNDQYTITAKSVKPIGPVRNDYDTDKDRLAIVNVHGVPPELRVKRLSRDVLVVMSGSTAGDYSFTYDVTDGKSDPVSARIDITILPEITLPDNKLPLAVADQYEINNGASLTITPLDNDSDPDGDTIGLSQIRFIPPALSVKEPGDNQLIVTANKPGTHEFYYEVKDDNGGKSEALISIIVPDPVDINRPPDTKPDPYILVMGEPLIINPMGNDSDPDGHDIRLVSIGALPEGLRAYPRPDGLISLHPSKRGDYDFTYEIADIPGDLRRTGRIMLSVSSPAPGNNPPIANQDNYTAEPGQTLVIFPMENDTDPEGLPLTLAAPISVSAELSVQMGIGESYQVTAGKIPGVFPIEYSIRDVDGAAAQSTIFITIEKDDDGPDERCRSTARLNEYVILLDGMATGLTTDFESANPLISELPGDDLWSQMQKLDDKIASAPTCSAEVQQNAEDIGTKLARLKARTSGVRPLEELRKEWSKVNDDARARLPRVAQITSNLPRCVPPADYRNYDQSIGTELEYIGDLDVKRLELLSDLSHYQPDNWNQESFDDLAEELSEIYAEIEDCPVEFVENTKCTGADCPEGVEPSGPDNPGLPAWIWPVGGALVLGSGLIGYFARGRTPAPGPKMPVKPSHMLRRISRADLRFRKDDGVPFSKSPLIASVTEPGPPPKEPLGHNIPAGLPTISGPFAALREGYRATGRIGFAQEGIPTNDDVSLGTGFLIAPNLVMTNQHVYEAYKHYLEGPECGGIEFIAERDRDASDYYAFDGNPPLVLPELDIAVFRLVKDVAGRTPIDRVHVPTDDLNERDVIVVGYPCPFEVDDYILKLVEPDPIFAIKRVTQGKVFRHSTDTDLPFGILFKVDSRINSSETLSAVCHNATTLPGNSGSPVLCAETGKLLGVHFAGSRSLFDQEPANLAMAIENILAGETGTSS